MTSPANSATVLAQRVKRFLDRERKRDEVLCQLLDALRGYPVAYLFGGVLRDIALFGIRDFDSDIDIVCTWSDDRLRSAVRRFAPESNRFGGFRIRTARWTVDLWRAQNTWAFRRGIIQYESVESLLRTTITNWESILYRLESGRILCPPTYFHDLSHGYVDIVLGTNPNPLGMSVRLLRLYAEKQATSFSSQATNLLSTATSRYSFEELSVYESEHYAKRFIDRATYNYISSKCTGAENGRTSLLPRATEQIPFP